MRAIVMAGFSVTKVKLGRPTYNNGSIRLLVDFFPHDKVPALFIS